MSSLSLTNDHIYLVLSEENLTNTYVYTYNGTNYESLQTLTIDSGKSVRNFISDDHQYLLIASADSSNKGYIFKFNDTTNLFELSQELLLSASVEYMSLTDDKEWLIVSTHDSVQFAGQEKTYIFTGVDEDNLTLLYVFDTDGYHHKLSKDRKFLVSSSEISKVFINCQADGPYYFNSATGECAQCSV